MQSLPIPPMFNTRVKETYFEEKMLKGCNVQMSPPHEMGFLILERSFYSK
jgi:hypothetical protein